jgi:PAS domain S-box-containing protein
LSRRSSARSLDDTLVRPTVANLDAVPVALIGCSRSGQITSWNQAATRLLGWIGADVVGRPIVDIVDRDVLAGVAIGTDRQIVARATTASGTMLEVELVIGTTCANDSGSVLLALTSGDKVRPVCVISGPRIESWAEGAAAIRGVGGLVQCVSVGLVGVEAVNRGYSRSTGDAVLREVVVRLARLTGASGRVLRIGGSQFLLVAPADKPIDVTRVVLELSAPIDTQLGSVRIGCFVGTASGDSVSAHVLLDRADAKSRRAGVRGVGAIECLPAEPNGLEARRHRLISLLIDAVARREITVQFQPIVDLTTGRITQYEALARWTSTELGEVDPASFIEAAESAGLIHEVGQRVLDAALDAVLFEQMAGRWDARRMSVNVSPVQLADPEFCNRITRALAERSLDGNVLQLELTQSQFIENVASAALHLHDLRRVGVSVAVDNFGTGRANMAYLLDLPVDVIKIDRRFVAGIPSSVSDHAVIRSIIALAADLALDVIAEGVETADQHHALIRLGCPSAQGFLYSMATDLGHLCRTIDLPHRPLSSVECPLDEAARLAALHAADVLDTPPEAIYDELVRAAAELCGTPIALISLIDEDRQWFKAKVGLEADQMPRDVAFCAHAICGDELMEVVDASLDERFRDNPFVLDDPFVRFYAGVPLRTAAGFSYGTLCVIDVVARRLSVEQRAGLSRLARQVAVLLELRQTVNELSRALRQRDALLAERDNAGPSAVDRHSSG